MRRWVKQARRRRGHSQEGLSVEVEANVMGRWGTGMATVGGGGDSSN